MSARLVVTLPPAMQGEEALAFASRARRAGADLLEVRTDLHATVEVDAPALARVLPLLIAARGTAVPAGWRTAAELVDRPLPTPGPAGPGQLCSLHAPQPLATGDALALWDRVAVPEGAQVKHVEPLGDLGGAARLLATQARLIDRFGPGQVTVLATGPLALPIRAALAVRNALDYVALDGGWSAVAGQRLLADAVRAATRPTVTDRLGLLGAGVAHSRSPRVHSAPFDRIELPEDAPLPELLAALRPHYRGLAVTAPFKQKAAHSVGAELAAVNTLVRRAEGGWLGANTDVAGAAACLRALGAIRVTVLGDGGATVALRAAAAPAQIDLDVHLYRVLGGATLDGACIWTWPPQMEAPAGLRFESTATVAVIAYGAPGHAVARQIRARGGRPFRLGARWFMAQARAQRDLWRNAR